MNLLRISLLPSTITSLSQTPLTSTTADTPPLDHRQVPPEPQTIPAAALLAQNPQCQILSSALSICTSLTPYFTELSPISQASCLCYSDTSYVPGIFDGVVKTCANYASSAVPEAYGAISNLGKFCEKAGDCCGRPFSGSTSRVDGDGTGRGGMDGCDRVQSYLSACESQTKGFLTMGKVEQASCLCLDTGSTWDGAAFDGAVKTCVDVASVEDVGIYSVLTVLNGFCAAASAATIASISASTTPLKTSPENISTESFSANTPSQPSPTSTQLASSVPHIYTTIPNVLTITIPTMYLPTQTGTGSAKRLQAKDSEVVLVSFLCAALVLFLC